MTAYEELRTGHVGEETIRLLYKVVALTARARNYPPPVEYATWTADAVVETAHEFMLSTNAPRRLVELAAQATDDEALTRLLNKTVVNFFRERGRASAVGKLIRRLRPLLAEDARFTFVPDGRVGAGNVALGSWADPDLFGGRVDDLLRAAYGVREVTVVRWGAEARREGPVADVTSLLALADAVLTQAAASLRLPDLATVIAVRLGIDPGRVPATVVIDDVDTVTSAAAAPPHLRSTTDPGPAAGSDVADAAADILAQLGERERLVAAHLHETVRVIADGTGLASSSAAAVKQRVIDKLVASLAGLGQEEADRVALSMRDQARAELGLDPV